MGAVIDRELFVESVQGTLIIVNSDGVQFMNDVIAICTIGGDPDDATYLCVGSGHTYSLPVLSGGSRMSALSADDA